MEHSNIETVNLFPFYISTFLHSRVRYHPHRLTRKNPMNRCPKTVMRFTANINCATRYQYDEIKIISPLLQGA
jgi:hypothetical protein